MSQVTKDELESLPLSISTMVLRATLDKLAPSDQSFAKDLLWSWDSKKKLSDKQAEWVVNLILRASTPTQEVSTTKLQGENLWTIFKMAGDKLKYPKITVQLDGVGTLALTLLRKSKYGENVSLTDGKPFGENQFYGRVSPDGVYTPHAKHSKAVIGVVTEFLNEMSVNPTETAAKYGKLSGKCMFCNSALTDENSTAAGFGPVCADNWGLKTEWKNAAKYKEQKDV